MSVAVVGIRVEVKGIGAAINAFAMLEKSIHGVTKAAIGLKGLKVPSQINFAQTGRSSSIVQRIGNDVVGGGSTAAVKKAAADVDRLAVATTKAGMAARAASPAMIALKAGMAQLLKTAASLALTLGKGLVGVLGAVGRGLLGIVGKALGAGAAIKTLGASVIRAGRSLSGFGSQMAMLGQRLMGFVTLPIVAMFVGTTKAAMDLEAQIIGLETTVGITKEEALAFKDGMMALVPALGAAPIELATAGYRILSSGIRDTSMALFVLERAGMMTAIGMGEVLDMARVTTAAFVAYGGESMETADQLQLVTDITDVFVAAVQRGASEADELVEPLGRLLGMASNLKVEIAEVTAFIGTFTAAGGTASEGVTAMTRIMASFVKETGKSKAALAAIGQTTASMVAILAEHGFGATLQFLASEFDDAGIALSEFIGRLPGLNAAMFLTGGAADLYAENLAEIKDGVGALDRAFETVQQSTAFQWSMMTASVQALAIAIGDVLLPVLNSFIQKMLPIIANIIAFTQLHPMIVKVALAFAGVVALIGPLVVGFGLFVTSLGAIVTMVGGAISVIGSLVSGLWLLAVPFVALAGIAALFAMSFKKFTDKLVDYWGDAITTTVEGVDGIEEVTETKFQVLMRHAKEWGSNIILSFAAGMARAAIAVVNVLIQIGNVIRGWLQGHSPPKLLPELGDWGANVIDVFLHGMTTADFSAFDKISSIMSSLFRSLSEEQMGEEGLIPAILGSRTAMAQALASGNMTADLLGRIVGSYGHLSTDAANYVMTMLELANATDAVKEAQEALNKENEEYSAQMDGLNKELESFRRFGEALNNADRKRVLERRLNDPRTSDEEKQLIVMELRALEIKQIQQGLTDEHDMNAEIAEAKLKAAKDEEERLKAQADMQLAILNIQIEQNNLMKEQIKLIEDLVEKLKKTPSAGGSGAGGMGAAGEPAGEPESLEDIIRNAVGNILGSGGEDDGELTLWDKVKELFAPLSGDEGLISGMTDVWSDIFLEVWRILDENKGTMATWISHAFSDAWNFAWPYIKTATVSFFVDYLWPEIQAVSIWLWTTVSTWMVEQAGLASVNIKAAWAGILENAMSGPVGEWWETSGKPVWEKLVGFIETYIIPAFQSKFDLLKLIFTNAFETISVVWERIVKPILELLAPLLGPLLAGLVIVASLLSQGFDILVTKIFTLGHAFQMWYLNLIGDEVDQAVNFFKVTLPAAIDTVRAWIQTVLIPWLQEAWAWLGEKFQAVKDFFVTAWEAIGEAIQWVWDNVFLAFWDWLGGWAEDVKEVAGTVTEWFNTVFVETFKIVWTFFTESLIPLFWAFWDVLTELWLLISGIFMETLTKFWNILWSALEPALVTVWEVLGDVWDIIKNSLLGVLEDLNPVWEWFKDLAILLWGALETLWGHLLKVDEWARAVLVQVGDLIWQTFLDKIESLAKWFLDLVGWVGKLRDHFEGAFKDSTKWWVDNVLTPMEGTLAKVSGWVQGLIDIFGSWAAVLRGIRIPEDMDEHSPSPLERSLTNARLAMEELMIVTEGLQSTFKKKTMLEVGANVTDADATARAKYAAYQAANATTAMREYGASGQVNVGPNSINNGMDMAVFEAMVRQAVAKALG